MPVLKYKADDPIGFCFYVSEDAIVKQPSGQIKRKCIFRCRCGRTFSSMLSNVRRRHTTSCGCIQSYVRGKSNLTHGCTTNNASAAASSIYSIYVTMMQRCFNEKNHAYSRYGAKGITVSTEWANSFETFRADMGHRPSLRHSVERIDNSKGYSKENCKWGTKYEQSNNRSNNITVDRHGTRYTLSQWSDELGFKYKYIYQKVKRDSKSIPLATVLSIMKHYIPKRITLNV